MAQLAWIALFLALVVQPTVAAAVAIDTNPIQSVTQDGSTNQEQHSPSLVPGSMAPPLVWATPQPTRMFEQASSPASAPAPANTKPSYQQRNSTVGSKAHSNATASPPAVGNREEAGHEESKKTSKPQPPAVASPSQYKRKHAHSRDHDSSSGSKSDLDIDIQAQQQSLHPAPSPETQETLELPPIPSENQVSSSSGNGMKVSDSSRPANALSTAAVSLVLLATLSVTG